MGSTLAEQCQVVMRATARGEIAPSQCSSILMGLASHARVIEIDDLVRRVEALEAEHREAAAINGHGRIFEGADAKAEPADPPRTS